MSFEDLVIVTFTGAIAGEQTQTWSFRGSKSRNKVSVGEPAEGSLKVWFRASGADRMLCKPSGSAGVSSKPGAAV